MPLFEFYCLDCQSFFEEICGENTQPACPKCASKRTEKQISAPSPQKKGAFPFKPGPVHPMAKRMATTNPCSSCQGSCKSDS